jgi:hypothetical protein
MTHKEATELVWAARSWFRQKSSSLSGLAANQHAEHSNRFLTFDAPTVQYALLDHHIASLENNLVVVHNHRETTR